MNKTVKRLLLATAAVACVFAGIADAAVDTRLMFFKGHTPGECHLEINKNPTLCDIALLFLDSERARVQFNNDDSGRMVIFEAKLAAKDSNTFIIDGITVGTMEGQPNKVRFTKATGLCQGPAPGLVGCTAQTADGQLFEVNLIQYN